MAGWRDAAGVGGTPVAAPAGLQQQTSTWDAGSPPPSLKDDQGKQAWQETKYAQDKQRNQVPWATGGNKASTENGFNSEFYQKMFDQQKQENEAGTLNQWSSRSDYTGIASHDGGTDANGRRVAFGDVYQDGKLQGNLLDKDSGYDEKTAYSLLMQVLPIDTETERRTYADLANNPNAVKELVQRSRDDSNKQFEAIKGQQAFNEKTALLKTDWNDDSEGQAVTAAGALGGAGLGAGVGTLILPGVGTVVGGVLGAAIGGVTSFLNKDAIVDQAARASVQTGIAGEQFGVAGGVSTGLKQWSGVAASAIAPASNLVQGLTDLGSKGGVGDDQAAYYTMQDRPGWLTALGVGAGFADAALQFASPIGQAAYLASTGASVIGGVGQLALQGGATWDDRTGAFDSPDNVGQWAAAIGAVGIDAIQTIGSRGIGRAAAIAGNVRAGDRLFYKINRSEGKTEEMAGMKFGRDANGDRTVRPTLTMLAPSEAVQGLSVRAMALRAKAQSSGVTPDDLYDAAVRLTSGSNPVKQALVNAFGEGTEEALQTALDPVSHGWDPNLSDVAMSYIMGAVTGAGMSVGARLGRNRSEPSSPEQRLSMANTLRAFQDSEAPQITAEQWGKMTPATQAVHLQAPPAFTAVLADARDKHVQGQERFAIASEGALVARNDAIVAKASVELNALNSPLDRSLRLALHSSTDTPARAVSATLTTTLANADAHLEGIRQEAEVRLAALQASTDPEEQAALQAGQQSLAEIVAAGVALRQSIAPIVAEIRESPDEPVRRAATARLNGIFQAAYRDTGNLPLSRAVSLIFSRDPQDNSGSAQVLSPWVDHSLTEYGREVGPVADGGIAVGGGILPATTADFDGDDFRSRAHLILDEAQFANMRTGTNLLGLGGAQVVERPFEGGIIRSAALALQDRTTVDGLNAANLLDEIRADLKADLGSYPGIDALLDAFIADLSNGREDARVVFSQALVQQDPEALRAIALAGTPSNPGLTDPLLEIVDQRVNRRLQAYQSSVASRKVDINSNQPVQGIPAGPGYRGTAGSQAVTPGQTMFVESTGIDPLRGFQGLNYSKERSAVDSARNEDNDSLIRQNLVEWYTELSSGISVDATQLSFAKDEVTSRAMEMLNKLVRLYQPNVRPRQLAARGLAGLVMPNIDSNGTDYGGYISVAQAVLRESAQHFARRDAGIIDSNPVKAQKYDVYSNASPEVAAREIFASTPIVYTLGEAAANLGHLTEEQAGAYYASKDPDQRAKIAAKWKADYRYNKAVHHDIPYSIEDYQSGAVSEYQVVIDSILGAANKELSMDSKTGQVHGSKADSDTSLIVGLEQSLKQLRIGIEGFSKLYAPTAASRRRGKTAAKSQQERIIQALDARPGEGKALFAAFTPEQVNVLVQIDPKTNKTTLPKWFFEMLTVKDEREAAMIFYRETFLADVVARDAVKDGKPIDDTLHQLFVELRQNPNKAEAEDFILKLLQAKDIQQFRAYVNKHHAYNRAPILAFFRDASAFDPSSREGGWNLSQPGAIQREALRKLSERTNSFAHASALAIQSNAADQALVSKLLSNPKDPMIQVLQQHLDQAESLNNGIGPAEMMHTLQASVMGISGGLTNKGLAGEAFLAFGKNSARGNSRSWGHGVKQLLDSLLSGGVDEVSGNMQTLNKGQRLQSRDGHINAWKRPQAMDFLKLWQNPVLQPMLTKMVFPSVWSDSKQEGRLTQQLLVEPSLVKFLSKETYKQILTGESLVDQQNYVSMLDAQDLNDGASYPVFRWAQRLAIARTSGKTRAALNPEEIEEIGRQAIMDVVNVVRHAASVPEAVLREDLLNVIKGREKAYAFSDLESKLQDLVHKSIVGLLDADVERLEKVGADKLDLTEARERVVKMRALFEAGDNEVGDAIRLYTIDWTSAEAEAKADLIYEGVLAQPDLAAVVAGKDGGKVAEIQLELHRNPSGSRPRMSVNEETDHEYWDAAGRALAQARIDQITTARSAGQPTAGIPHGKAGGYVSYWDNTWRFLIDDLLQENSPVLNRARRFAESVQGVVRPTSGPNELSEIINRTIYRDWSLGDWTPTLALEMVTAEEHINSSGAGDQIEGAGISYAEEFANSMANRRTDLDPMDPANGVSVAPRNYKIEGGALVSEDALFTAGAAVDESGRTEALLFFNGAFITGATVTFNGQTVSLATAPLRPSFRPPTTDTTATSSALQATSLNRLLKSVQSLVPEGTDYSITVSALHPDDQPLSTETQNWANNVFFNGTVFDNGGDVFNSVNGASFFGPGGINSEQSRLALDAVKEGSQAIRQAELAPIDEVRSMEDVLDVSGSLQRKVLWAFTHSAGHGKISPDLRAGIVATLKAHHAVRAVVEEDDGTSRPVILSMEEVLAHQAQNPGTLPQVDGKDLQFAELQAISMPNLRALYGDTGSRSTPQPLLSAPGYGPESILKWNGHWDSEVVARVMPGFLDFKDGAWQEFDWATTTLVQVTADSQESVPTPLSGKYFGLYAKRQEYKTRRIEEGYGIRENRNGMDRIKSFTEKNRGVLREDGALASLLPELTPRALGINIDLGRVAASQATQDIINAGANSTINAITEFNGFRALWMFDYDNRHKGTRFDGVIHGVSQLEDAAEKTSKANNILPDDGMLIDLGAFSGSTDLERELRTVLQRLTGLGIVPILINTKDKDALSIATRILRDDLNHDLVPGSRSVFYERNPESQYQTKQSVISRLGETDEIVSTSHILSFQTDDLAGAFENSVMIDRTADRNGAEVLDVHDLVPSGQYGYLGRAQSEEQALAIYNRLTAMIDDPDALKILAKLGGMDEAETQALLVYAVENMDPATALPGVDTVLRPGDVIVESDSLGNLLFTRHGFKPPKSAKAVEKQLATEGAGFAIYGNSILNQATTHSMTIRQWIPTNGYGLRVRGGIPLSEYFDKSVKEGTGFKGTTTPLSIAVPDHDVIGGWRIREYQSLTDALSKEDNLGVINNARNAIAYLGADFTPALARTIFGIEPEAWSSLSLQDQAGYYTRVRELLLAVSQSGNQSLTVVNDLIQLGSGTLQDTLGTLLDSEIMTALNPASTLTADLVDQATPEQQITRAAILYMLAPNASPEHVMSATGFAGTGTQRSTRMPRVFTNIFDRARGDSDLRKYLITGLNDKLANRDSSQGYTLLPDYSFVITPPDGKAPYYGRLQFAEAHSSGDNVVLDEMASRRNGGDKVSQQYMQISEQAYNLALSQVNQLKGARDFAERKGYRDLEDPDSLWRMMSNGPLSPRKDFGTPITRTLTRGEREFKRAAAVGATAFMQPLNLARFDTDSERADYSEARATLLNKLNLSASYTGMVDTWVRQWLAAPKDANPTTEGGEGIVYFKAAMDALNLVTLNIENGALPTHGSEVPLMHHDHLWALYNASRDGRGFRPVMGRTEGKAQSWVEFVDTAFGSAQKSRVQSWLQLPLDGFMHSYGNADESLQAMPISLDQFKSLQLLDPSTEDLLLSFDPGTNLLIQQMPVFDDRSATYEDIFGGQVHAGVYQGKYPPKSAMASRLKAVDRWKDKKNVQEQMARTLSDVRASGYRYRNEGTATSGFLRVLINIRVAQGMSNPLLIVSAPVEAFFRSALEGFQSVITGDSIGAISLGSEMSPETRKAFRDAAKDSAGNPAFTAMLHHDLFAHPKLANAGWTERVTAVWSRTAAKAQDPTYGLRPVHLAEVYIRSIVQYYNQSNAENMTPEAAVALWHRNPVQFSIAHPEAHQMALNTIANLRSMRATPQSLAYRGVVDSLTRNPHFAINVPSTLMLKLPFMFQNFAFNYAENILGLHGINGALAVLMSGNTGGKKFGRIQAFLAGESYSEGEQGTDILGEIQSSVDFADRFIRDGLTHTGLMAAALLVGGLGLDGDDEESKRQRRLASVQGARLMDDPRKLINDFRNADTIYLDSIPWLSEWFKTEDGRSPAVMNWVVKQFVSPALGIAKFADTGNFAQVIYGFQDALGSMPLINTNGWDDAVKTANELYAASLDSEARGTPEDLANASNFLLQGVSSLERMLFENSFVNSLYTSMDKYDRDPWILPEVDGDGKLVRDNLSTPMKTELQQQYFNEDGSINTGAVGRNWDEATLRQFGENRATFGFLASLFTGTLNSQNSMLRYDQAVKTRSFDKAGLAEPDAEQLLLSVWDPENKREVLTRDGGEAVLRGLNMGSVRVGDPALQNVFISFEDRQAIQTSLQTQIMQEGVDAGLSPEAAAKRLQSIWFGSTTNPYATPLSDVVWSNGKYKDSISYQPKTTYRQLNTTYVTGPDGRPAATGVERASLLNFFGQGALSRYQQADGNLGQDARLNTTDPFAQLNTGSRSLEKVDDTLRNPTQDDILAAIKAGFDDVVNSVGKPSYGSNPYGGYSRRGGSGGGGGGGTYRLYSPKENDPTNNRNTPYVNPDNPLLRRATIRRERFSSERGRLLPWQ